jgi:hypothetical protein
LTEDDRRRGTTANQAGNGERGCANAKKFHANLTSCRIAKLRFNVVAAAVGRLWYSEVPHTISKADFCSRSHDPVIRVYDAVGDVIATHEHKGEFKEVNVAAGKPKAAMR